jgi:hypothetical protein
MTTNTAAWRKDRPALIGDYIASRERNTEMRRHWDGEAWSAPWRAADPEDIAARARRTRAERPMLGEVFEPIRWQQVERPQ